jgi:nucleotide-binding universal stress UspA family protein
MRAELVPVYALPDLWLAGGLFETPVILPEVYEVLVRDAREQIERFVKDALPPALRSPVVLRTGPAATSIAEVARTRRAGLIVLGGKHHAALARGLGRSTAHYLVRTLDVPLLVVGQATGPVTRVLAAVDLSAAAPVAIRAAEQFGGLLGARVRVVHVLEPLRLMYVPVGPLDEAGFEQRSREAFERLMRSFASIAHEDRVVRSGLAAEALVEEASSWHAQLLVVGSHGKGWADRLLVGSTTERLLNVLPVSLLVIPTAPAIEATQQSAKTKARRRAPREKTTARV